MVIMTGGIALHNRTKVSVKTFRVSLRVMEEG